MPLKTEENETSEERNDQISMQDESKVKSNSISVINVRKDYKLIKNYKTIKFIRELWKILKTHYDAKNYAALHLGLGEYFFYDIKKNVFNNVIEKASDYIITPRTLDSIEFNIEHISLNEDEILAVFDLIDDYRIWVYNLLLNKNQRITIGMLRYRPHRPGDGNFDDDIRLKMKLIRELQAACTKPKKKIENQKIMKSFFGSKFSYKRLFQDEITVNTSRSTQIAISTILPLIVLSNLKDFVIDKPRALNVLYNYVDIVYGFRLEKPTCRLALMLLYTFTLDPFLTGFYGPVPSFREIANWIQETTNESFGIDLIPNNIREERIITGEKINLIIYTIEKRISIIRVKEYTIAYLKFYKNRYSATSAIQLIRRCIIGENFKESLREYELLAKYLSQVKKNKGEIPEVFLTDERRQKATRISSFNNRITYIDSEIKSKFIAKLLKSKIKLFKPNEASGSFEFINILIALSHNRNYRKEHILSHRSPSHEVILPNLTYKYEWVIGSEIPIYLDSLKKGDLTGHIDLLVIIDNKLYVCDYKPDENPLATRKPSISFINSLPQIAIYALILKRKNNIKKIECITFNKKGARLYNPNSILKSINRFMQKYRKDMSLPWIKFV